MSCESSFHIAAHIYFGEEINESHDFHSHKNDCSKWQAQIGYTRTAIKDSRKRMLSNLQAAAVVDCGLQGYPRDKDTVVSVDAIALPYVQPQRLAWPFDYLDKVDGVLWILEHHRNNKIFLINSTSRALWEKTGKFVG